MKELLKWLAALGAGLLYSLGEQLLLLVKLIQPAAEAGTLDFFIQTAVIAAVAKIAAWGVGKIPKPAPAEEPPSTSFRQPGQF